MHPSGGLLVERGHWDPLRSTVLLAYCESYAAFRYYRDLGAHRTQHKVCKKYGITLAPELPTSAADAAPGATQGGPSWLGSGGQMSVLTACLLG